MKNYRRDPLLKHYSVQFFKEGCFKYYANIIALTQHTRYTDYILDEK